MAAKILLDEIDSTVKQLVLRTSSTFTPTVDLRHETGATVYTSYDLSLNGVAAGASRQGVKVDFGAVRAPMYEALAVMEFAASVAAGKSVDLFIVPSNHSTAGSGNLIALTGTDAAYTGYASNADAALAQVVNHRVGSFVTTTQATTTVQVGSFGRFVPGARWGCPVVRNRCAVALGPDVRVHIVLNPIFVESQ